MKFFLMFGAFLADADPPSVDRRHLHRMKLRDTCSPCWARVKSIQSQTHQGPLQDLSQPDSILNRLSRGHQPQQAEPPPAADVKSYSVREISFSALRHTSVNDLEAIGER